MLKVYLEINYASPAASPEDEIYDSSDDEYDKKMFDIAINLNNEENNLGSSIGSSPEFEGSKTQQKSKGAKLQSVAKQFGSIGKSMSKKIKKNIGTITKFGKSAGSSKFPLPSGILTPTNHLLCARMRAKRHEYQEEMIKNYLDCAYERFSKNKVKDKDVISEQERIVHCINTSCNNFATEKNFAQMCTLCYEKQVVDLNYSYQPPRYGTGKSKFYTQSDIQSHNVVKHIPSVKKLTDLDQTLYLSKSTFFNDIPKLSHNTLGIPLSPPEPTVLFGKTTIIPIRVEERPESDENLMNYDSVNSTVDRRNCAKPDSNIDVYPRCDVDRVDGPNLKCRSPGCSFFGSQNTGYCSKCQKVPVHQYRKLQTEI